MKFRNIFWGVILIVVGVLFILQNLHVVDFEWVRLWRLWPVLLVLWGISILPANNWIKSGLLVVVLGGSLYFMLDQTIDWRSDRVYIGDYNYDYEYDDSKTVINQDFDIPYEDSLSMAYLDFEAAAGSFYLNDTTNQLLSFTKKGKGGKFTYAVKRSEEKASIYIEREDGDLRFNDDNKSAKIKLALNPEPVWDVNLDVGAAKLDFDLSKFKVKKLDLDGGAASFEIKLGDRYEKSYVNIDAGASEIIIKVPAASGCDLNLSTVLSGRTISGFEKVDHGHYRTDNFDSAQNKIYITVDAAVSSYTITRY
ncbi:MAG: hypothetical protein KQH67_05375 [Bacteroidetes bacterium]|nr:hypothetical protein [Bacteroidota bacterium]